MSAHRHGGQHRRPGARQSSGADAKAVVFSDSRQDAARAALNIEGRHHQDVRRQMLIEIVQQKSREASARPSREQLTAEARRAMDSGRTDDAMALLQQVKDVHHGLDARCVPLMELIERIPTSGGPNTNALLAQFVRSVYRCGPAVDDTRHCQSL